LRQWHGSVAGSGVRLGVSGDGEVRRGRGDVPG